MRAMHTLANGANFDMTKEDTSQNEYPEHLKNAEKADPRKAARAGNATKDNDRNEKKGDESGQRDADGKQKKVSLGELIRQLGVSGTDGLTDEEAQKRLARYGPNELREEKPHPILQFLAYFWGPIPWMIEAAAILSAVVEHWTDLIIISVLLLMNAVVGFWEEHQAGNAIDALKKKLALQAKVRRGGQWRTIPSREVVPGDVVRVRLGDIVPADAKLLQGDPIEVDQSSLTGESLPVERKTEEDVYSGSVISQGEIDALVYGTNGNTYFGKTAKMVEEAKTVSHFQKAVLKIGDYLIVIALVLVALIVVVAMFRHEHFLTVLRFALVLTVAAVPVAMPTVLSVTMAVGAKILAGKEAIVRKLSSVEEMAGIDVLCSDKTGTLTQNKLTLGDPAAMNGAQPGDVILCGALASREEDNDPIDLAVLRGLGDKAVLQKYEILHFQPFDPVHKRTEAVVKGPDGKTFKVTKGAVQVVQELVGPSDEVKTFLDKAVADFADHGFRSLGVARADQGGRWRYLGVLPLYDPPREDSKQTIATAEEMGLTVKMVTGDQVVIAKEIARQIGLGTNILDAASIPDTKHHETGQLADKIVKADGFAQVFPEHKYHIVDVLQQNGHIVGMTGDGVNDAPALKKADAGIAVSGATDAARSASAIVLLTPGLSVIIDAVRESRKIFQRMFSYATYRITETIRVLLFMTLSILVFKFYPVTAIMIVLLAILNDGAILSIAYDRAIVSPKPEKWNMHLTLGLASVLGVMGVIESFGLLYIAKDYFHMNLDTIRSLIYLKLSLAGHLTIFVTRTRHAFWSHRPSWILLGAVVGTQTLATLITVYGWLMAPIGWHWAFVVWGYCLVWFFIEDRFKLGAYKVFQKSHSGYFGKRHAGD